MQHYFQMYSLHCFEGFFGCLLRVISMLHRFNENKQKNTSFLERQANHLKREKEN